MYNFKKFFTYLVVGALIFGLISSCSNEDTTGGGSGDEPLEVIEQANNSYDITVVSSSSSVYSAGTIGFSVSGASDYNVSIQSVDNGSNPLILDASDFSYNKSTKELTLISSGITKLNNATLTEATAYQYTITFKFVDSSDTSKEKTIDVKVNLYKAKVITKTEIEAMIKSMGAVTVSDSSYSGTPVNALFNFSSATFQNNEPNFKSSNSGSAVSDKKFDRSYGSALISSSLTKTENYKKYFSGYSYKPLKASGVNLTLYFPLTLRGGYALSSEVAHLMSDGLSIQLTLTGGQTWE